MEKIAKHGYNTAYELDSASVTVTKEFANAILIMEPEDPLEKEGIIRVKNINPKTDTAVFTLLTEASLTFTEIDARGSEDPTAAGSSQPFPTPTYKSVTATTKSAEYFVFENIDLLNKPELRDFTVQMALATKKAKVSAGFTELFTQGNYTAGTSFKKSNGYAAIGTISGSQTLIPSDLVSAVDGIKIGQKVDADVCLIHRYQRTQLETHSDFSPGQSSNANFRRAQWNERGILSNFYGLDIIECAQIDAISSGYFASETGRWVVVGKRGLMLGRAEHPAKNRVRPDPTPRAHGIWYVIDINYGYEVLYPDSIRLIACSDDPD